MAATRPINFFPKTQVVMPVYDKIVSIMPHCENLSEIEKIFWLLRIFLENKRNSAIAKYMADYRFLLRGQNVLASVIKT